MYLRRPFGLLASLAGAALGLTLATDAQQGQRRLEHAPPTPAPSASTGLFALELPELGLSAESGSTTRLARVDVARLLVRVRRSPSQLDYGAVQVRVNTEAANIVMTTRGTRNEVLCDLDLRRRAGFELRPGRNSIEVEILDRGHRRAYGSFLVDVGEAESPVSLWSKGDVDRAPGRRYAVVVGVSRYAHAERGVPHLRFAASDARAVRDFLVAPDGGGFQPERVRLLVDEQATSANLRSSLFTFLTEPGPDDLVVIYFAGHGAPDPRDPRLLYLITHDTDPRDMGGTAFPMWDLPTVLGRVVKARRVLVLADACHSQGVGGAAGGGAATPINLAHQYLARYARDAQHALLTASGISEASLEGPRWGGGHGVFTFFALRGLRGQADGDRDGTVTAGELFVYVRDHVRRETAGQQTPTAVAGLASDLALIRVRRAAFEPWGFFRKSAAGF
jgi:hypothetical protein